MHNGKKTQFWREFHGPNAGYVLEAYEQFQSDHEIQMLLGASPDAVDGISLPIEKISGVVRYALAIREYGHLAAQLDPLGSPPPGDASLELETYQLTEEDLSSLPASLIGGACAEDAANALDASKALREVYTGYIGYDYDHLHNPEERQWLVEVAESRRFHPDNFPIHFIKLLERLTEVEIFEQFLHRIFPGVHRFSIEGLDMMVPMLDTIVDLAAEEKYPNLFIGMAHRGRLNVLAHILRKPIPQILAEFKDPAGRHPFLHDLGWTGDVKYHKGAHAEEPSGLAITLAPNPSHVEAVNPVIEGMARAFGTTVDNSIPHFNPLLTLPILIHGDAAFPGQGIVAETLNLAGLAGYSTGGTIHIIANNQLGFTTSPHEAHSTLYASDLAKGFKMPIVHVNADDPGACIEAARLAFAYRNRFNKDFVIDLIGYRRHGHNEGDEPSFTQPTMYEIIEKHPTVREQQAQSLTDVGEITEDQAQALAQNHMQRLQDALESLDIENDLSEPVPDIPPAGTAKKVKTAVAEARLLEVHQSLLDMPEDFHVHRKIQRFMERRHENLHEKKQVDWAAAEELALASILQDGTAIRLTGEDSERGTFNHRHAVLHDAETGETHIPLQTLQTGDAFFEIYNSPLTENAALGFEFGFDIQKPDCLVIWEAQYGDFINTAWAVIDEFIVSARSKWGQSPAIVLLLPHGSEGAGPDHSSARLERFLSLFAGNNIRIANPTTAAQFFHLLRRQALLLQTDPLPLIVMTPKSLLRHPLTTSSIQDLSQGGWQPVLDDPNVEPKNVKRLLPCNGKIYVDLVTSEHYQADETNAVIRLEQLAPFPEDELSKVFDRYANVEEVIWVQEEPQNMGAWEFVNPRLRTLMDDRRKLCYVGRARSSSPAEGSSAWYAENQARLVAQAFGEIDKDKDDFIIG